LEAPVPVLSPVLLVLVPVLVLLYLRLQSPLQQGVGDAYAFFFF
jgi:hypothetical protein